MEKSNFDESVFFFFRFDERNMYRPRCEKKERKNYKQNKLERGREEWEEKKTQAFFFFFTYSKRLQRRYGRTYCCCFFSRRCIVRRYSREDTSASAFKHEWNEKKIHSESICCYFEGGKMLFFPNFHFFLSFFLSFFFAFVFVLK